MPSTLFPFLLSGGGRSVEARQVFRWGLAADNLLYTDPLRPIPPPISSGFEHPHENRVLSLSGRGTDIRGLALLGAPVIQQLDANAFSDPPAGPARSRTPDLALHDVSLAAVSLFSSPPPPQPSRYLFSLPSSFYTMNKHYRPVPNPVPAQETGTD